jgi:sugar lactone lactonase YvrE
MNRTAEVAFSPKAILGEGAIWCPKRKRLIWVDILSQNVNIYDPIKSDNQIYNIGQDVGTVVSRESGGFILAVRDGFASFDPDTKNFEMVALQKTVGIRFNDGKCDPAGRFWAGTMADNAQEGVATLYCLERDLSVSIKIPAVTISNGLVWSLDKKKFYYIDTPTRQIVSYDYNNTSGHIENCRVAIEIDNLLGKPDGMTIDEEDMIHIALWEGGKVARYNPRTGKRLSTIEVPAAKKVTSCAFGGENLDELFITTASVGLTETELKKQANAGHLFRMQMDVKGVPAFEFKG